MTMLDRFYRARSQYWRLKRLAFPSPAEVRFLELMGAKVCKVPYIRTTLHGFTLAVVLNRGKVLRNAKMKREVRIGKCYVDFGNDIGWVIECDGTLYHQDVVAEFDREIYMKDYLRRHGQDLRILRIPAPRLWHDRARVQRDVLKFLSA